MCAATERSQVCIPDDSGVMPCRFAIHVRCPTVAIRASHRCEKLRCRPTFPSANMSTPQYLIVKHVPRRLIYSAPKRRAARVDVCAPKREVAQRLCASVVVLVSTIVVEKRQDRTEALRIPARKLHSNVASLSCSTSRNRSASLLDPTPSPPVQWRRSSGARCSRARAHHNLHQRPARYLVHRRPCRHKWLAGTWRCTH